jgi:lipoyl-dependent peroxiredoxin
MKIHRANAIWKKGLKEGSGELETANGGIKSSYSFATRFGDSTAGTTPEELIGAAHAGCFSMFLSGLLEKQNSTPEYIKTDAKVTLGEKDGATLITKIELTTEAKAEGISNDDFQKLVQDAKAGCPVSKSLAAVSDISVTATLNK